ncbi:MAG: phage major capsid protein [Rhodoferax sp.]
MIYTRELRFDAGAAIAIDALIPCTIATTTPVMRSGTGEILDCTPAGVDLGRAPLPLISGHDATRLAIGLVENLQATGDKVTGHVRFGTSPEAQQIRADVVAGIHRSLSVGYAHLSSTDTPAGTVYRWQPHEVSIVSVPADSNAGFFRSNPESKPMTTNTNPDAEITELCTRHKMPELATTLNRDGATIEQARAAVLTEMATRDQATGGHRNVAPYRDSVDNERQMLIETLVARLGGKPKGEIIRSTDCAGLAIRALELGGQAVNYRDGRDALIVRAMSTSDFPNLLGNAAGRVLLQSFDDSPAVLKQVARLNNLSNFKPRTVIRLPGGAPSLEKVNEGGEFTQGAIAEEANAWSLTTFGRIVSLTRQAMVNDDLDAFSGLLTEFGRAAARREADELVSMLTGTPLVDGTALFHADRSSLITGAPSVLSAPGLAASVKSLRLQKEVGGGFIIQEPTFLVVPAALETTARQLVASITPSAAASVQPYTLTVIVEPRLDAASATAWYLVSGNQSALEYGYLDAAQGPQTFQEEGFEIDGLKIKCRLDFGTGWVSPIGWVKSAGA